MSSTGEKGLAPEIVAALDETLVEGTCDAGMLTRLRKLIENCLADNYDASDVRAVIDLAMDKCDTGEADDGA